MADSYNRAHFVLNELNKFLLVLSTQLRYCYESYFYKFLKMGIFDNSNKELAFPNNHGDLYIFYILFLLFENRFV